MLIVVAPGQGAQSPGFLAPWLELPRFEERLRWLSACAGLDLVRYGTEADADEIRDTAVAQPLLVGAGLVSLLTLFPHPSDAFQVVGAGAGHSVGEITAAAAAGVVSAEQAMVLVRERGRAMAAAAAVTPTGMSAILGGDPDEVIAAIERHGLTAANHNAAGQVVAGGTLEQLAALAADAPAKTRVIPLQVAGAFHTHHMAPAAEVLGSYARAVSTHDPRIRLLSNRDGGVVQQGHEALDRIVGQVARPVRWDLVMQTMADLGVTAVIEVPAGRHPHGPGQARAPRRRGRRPQDPGRPRRRPRPDRPARVARHARPRALVAAGRGPGQGDLQGPRRQRPRRQPRCGGPGGRGDHPARRARGRRGARRHRRRVAGRGRRPGVPRAAARPAASRGGPGVTAIRPAEGHGHASILGVGGYRPARIVTNAEICEQIDSTDEWIRERSGIAERRHAAPGETVVDMAVAAAEKALAASGITADRLDAVVVGTVTHLYQTPAAATLIAHRLGATSAAAFDLSAACAGFCHGLAVANDLVRGGSARHVLVIGVERLTDMIDPTDRGTAFIFGDGAGAAVVGPSAEPGIGPVVWGADGGQAEAITQNVSWDALREDPGTRSRPCR